MMSTVEHVMQREYRSVLVPFIVISLSLHVVVLTMTTVFQKMDRQIYSSEPFTMVLVNPVQPDEPAATTPQADTKKPLQTFTEPEDKTDLWNKSMAMAHELMLQPDFREKYLDKPSLIPNHRENLLGSGTEVSEVAIESFKDLNTDEVMVVFRYPDGSVICARARRPDPLNDFDMGSWTVVMTGCN